MNKYTTIAQAEAKILKLEEKQRNLQANFDAMAHGNRQRVRQYEAEIDRLKTELKGPCRVTITESELRAATETVGHSDVGPKTKTVLSLIGITIIPDPEPTNAEKLADVYRSWCGLNEVPNSLIRFMDQAGVTAPEEK